MVLVNIALYCSKAEIRVPGGWGGGGGGWCKPIIVSNPQPSYFGLLFGWVAVAWLGFGVMTTDRFIMQDVYVSDPGCQVLMKISLEDNSCIAFG